MTATWLDLEATYEGKGRAEFTDPPGHIEGLTRLHFSESGEVTCEMTAPEIHPVTPIRFGCFEFLSGEKLRDDGNKVTMGLSGFHNRCKVLEVQTASGLFRSFEPSLGGFNSDLITIKRLGFHPWRSELVVTPAPAPPMYWVLPLWNFRSDFRGIRTPVDTHPLRFSPPAPPSTAGDPNTRLMEDWAAASHNEVIWFPLNGKAAYIEPLPDYKERIQKLQDGLAQRLITAVMVGDLGSLPLDLDSFQHDFPVQILTLIGLATGVEVGTPWIDLRDSSGTLCRRLHIHLGSPHFREARQSISQLSSRGIGYLVAKGLESPYLGEDCFMVAARNLMRAAWTRAC